MHIFAIKACRACFDLAAIKAELAFVRLPSLSFMRLRLSTFSGTMDATVDAVVKTKGSFITCIIEAHDKHNYIIPCTLWVRFIISR